MFELDRFVETCREALGESENTKALREVVAREVTDPASVTAGLGTPERGGIHCLYQAPDITILNVIWAPYMTIMPHNHNMWAVIGVYSGREDNIFWRRLGNSARSRHHPFGDQPDHEAHRCDPHLWRRLHHLPAQRMGTRDFE